MQKVGSVALILEVQLYMPAVCNLLAKIDGSSDDFGDATTELKLYASRRRNPRGNQLEEPRFAGLNRRLQRNHFLRRTAPVCRLCDCPRLLQHLTETISKRVSHGELPSAES